MVKVPKIRHYGKRGGRLPGCTGSRIAVTQLESPKKGDNMTSIEPQPSINPAKRRNRSDRGVERAPVVVSVVGEDPRRWPVRALDIVEQVLQSWPATMRLALLMVILLTGVAVTLG
jgi:hypothetical protein